MCVLVYVFVHVCVCMCRMKLHRLWCIFYKLVARPKIFSVILSWLKFSTQASLMSGLRGGGGGGIMDG